MAATAVHPGVPSVEWEVAERLAHAVAEGGSLPELESPVLLDSGEVLHACLDLDGWRYQALDVAYEHRRGFVVGGPVLFGLSAAVTGAANRRVRAAAGRLAAPQWRPLGQLQVLATSHRLLVLHEGAWASVWFEAICQIRPALSEGRLELVFEDDPPYLLQGPGVPYLMVALTTVLAERFGTSAVAATLVPS